MARTERKADQIRDVEIFPLCNPLRRRQLHHSGAATRYLLYHRHRGRKGAAPCA